MGRRSNPMLQPPIRLCCGQPHLGPVCPDGKVMCCLCFERVEQERLSIGENGVKENVCRECVKRERMANGS